eukprot:TRINITY_DN2714_c0_g1_i1.p1 TRINITY_DN2714_c0_g1~~TRINITY_DN2714_c0_g1_i1.p1  ORF type:complete len:513 (+),score=138.42 TRINITY_DN2714_c0_g1_i1:62-1600(+)
MVFNFNIGIFGHVDHGKSCLAKLISTTASTAAFDKHPSSQARGITQDLGFSAFKIPTPEHLANQIEEEEVQVTVVDCPGHENFIHTIISGSAIIDLVLLVIDVSEGVKPQTLEAIILANLINKPCIIVLNKIDLIPQKSLMKKLQSAQRRLQHSLAQFENFSNVPFAATSCVSGFGVDKLISLIGSQVYIPERIYEGYFEFLVDHCFQLKGKGTVLTGTCTHGSINLNDPINVNGQSFDVKGLQVFKQPVESIKAGDRAGILVKGLKSDSIERTIVADHLQWTSSMMLRNIEPVIHHNRELRTKANYHFTIGNQTVLGSVLFLDGQSNVLPLAAKGCYAYVHFQSQVLARNDMNILASRLDLTNQSATEGCRFAFQGEIHDVSVDLSTFFIYEDMYHFGKVTRVGVDGTVQCEGLTRKDSDMALFEGRKVLFLSEKAAVLPIDPMILDNIDLKSCVEGIIIGKHGASSKKLVIQSSQPIEQDQVVVLPQRSKLNVALREKGAKFDLHKCDHN